MIKYNFILGVSLVTSFSLTHSMKRASEKGKDNQFEVSLPNRDISNIFFREYTDLPESIRKNLKNNEDPEKILELGIQLKKIYSGSNENQKAEWSNLIIACFEYIIDRFDDNCDEQTRKIVLQAYSELLKHRHVINNGNKPRELLELLSQSTLLDQSVEKEVTILVHQTYSILVEYIKAGNQGESSNIIKEKLNQFLGLLATKNTGEHCGIDIKYSCVNIICNEFKKCIENKVISNELSKLIQQITQYNSACDELDDSLLKIKGMKFKKGYIQGFENDKRRSLIEAAKIFKSIFDTYYNNNQPHNKDILKSSSLQFIYILMRYGLKEETEQYFKLFR